MIKLFQELNKILGDNLSEKQKKDWESFGKYFCPLSPSQDGDCLATCAWFIGEKQTCAVKILAIIMAKEEIGIDQK